MELKRVDHVGIAVKNLEESLGEPIFLRKNYGVVLTPFGESILPYIRDALNCIDQILFCSHIEIICHPVHQSVLKLRSSGSIGRERTSIFSMRT